MQRFHRGLGLDDSPLPGEDKDVRTARHEGE
jgi:hypothetical protein